MSHLIKLNGNYIVKDIKLPKSAEITLNSGMSVKVSVLIVDERQISEQQRKFIFALVNDMSFHSGNDAEWERMLMQQFNANLREIEVESLSNCSMSYANGLIDTIITHMIEREVPISKATLNDNKYNFTLQQIYAMTLKRVCAVCGTRADIHHLDKIGMGNNRNKVSHLGRRILPLCRTHHNEIHNTGDVKFMEKYHLEPIIVDEKLDFFIRKGTLRTYKKDNNID